MPNHCVRTVPRQPGMAPGQGTGMRDTCCPNTGTPQLPHTPVTRTMPPLTAPGTVSLANYAPRAAPSPQAHDKEGSHQC